MNNRNLDHSDRIEVRLDHPSSNRSRTAIVRGWCSRHDRHPSIKREVKRARADSRWQLMFRGQKTLDYEDEIFLIGQKSKPNYHGGDICKARLHARSLSTDSGQFMQIASAFVQTPMTQRQDKRGFRGPSVQELMDRYENSNPLQRFILSQLLIEGLHYQNNRKAVGEWRDRLFVISCTKDEKIALRYALSPREEAPKRAYVLEYAPPTQREYFRDVDDVLREFRSLKLGYFYRNYEQEIFVPFGMFPHYLLGYAILDRDAQGEYETRYKPNPEFRTGRATLENPPDLNDKQQEVIRATQDSLAWGFKYAEPEDDEWVEIRFPDGPEPIGPPRIDEE